MLEFTSSGRLKVKAHEVKAHVDDAVQVLLDACDTDQVLWSARGYGRDVDAMEDSGYLQGYRDALSAVQRLVGHGDATTLTTYLGHVRDNMREAQVQVEDATPGDVHFWSVQS